MFFTNSSITFTFAGIGLTYKVIETLVLAQSLEASGLNLPSFAPQADSRAFSLKQPAGKRCVATTQTRKPHFITSFATSNIYLSTQLAPTIRTSSKGLRSSFKRDPSPISYTIVFRKGNLFARFNTDILASRPAFQLSSPRVLPPDIWEEIGDYLDEPERYWWQLVILKHTGNGLPPKREGSESPPPPPLPTKAQLVGKYLKYLEDELEAQNTWRRLVNGLCDTLPTEMRLVVIKRYLESLFPRTIDHNHIRFGHHVREFSDIVPAKDRFEVAITEIANEILEKVNSQIVDMHAEHTMTFNAQEIVSENVEEAIKLIPQLCTYILPANFPSRNSAATEVVPTFLQPQIHNIKHLELSTRVVGSDGTARYYPVELFKAQDHIANLGSWFPELQSLAFTIVDGTKGQRRYFKRGFSQQDTTFAAEVEKIVEQMLKLDVAEMGIRLCISNVPYWTEHTYDWYHAEKQSAWDDASEVDTDGLSCRRITMTAIAGDGRGGVLKGFVFTQVQDSALLGRICGPHQVVHGTEGSSGHRIGVFISTERYDAKVVPGKEQQKWKASQSVLAREINFSIVSLVLPLVHVYTLTKRLRLRQGWKAFLWQGFSFQRGLCQISQAELCAQKQFKTSVRKVDLSHHRDCSRSVISTIAQGKGIRFFDALEAGKDLTGGRVLLLAMGNVSIAVRGKRRSKHAWKKAGQFTKKITCEDIP
ncbi:uncharacterized protein MYCFIDRAFT_177514 [Pseudocercospora fijiensis CIRAD86]|uniref:Uncharacterized protein n=1 Tax=Pseudocercospora fijiensis (strain CIRAD86) TaxID=383855 RepID=M2YS57_PSEFD|nr:uncharacterized protein MYCFIDRAFT_177514 [Pseudocercospora fijiensis CIRAD86]EME80575.1 hypothetical protein MYCFIDRAFT_177514 [Pseudocercospora fijiensis CIRAD86]